MTIPCEPIAARGPLVSDLIAGFWRLHHWGFTTDQLVAYIEELIELGVTTVDHAMVYRSEAIFGSALAVQPSLRQHLQIVTKCGIRPCGFGPLGAQNVNHYDASSAAIMDSVEASLQALGTDYIDILLLHRPDYLMDVNEVATAFDRLKTAGKVRAFGVSNFSKDQFALLHGVWPELMTNQIEFSPLTIGQLDSGLFEQCQLTGIRPMIWSCLGGGRLLQPQDEAGRRVLMAIDSVAAQFDMATPEQVVYAWVRQLPARPIPLLGSSQIERIRSAVKALRINLNREQWYAIWEAANGAPVP